MYYHGQGGSPNLIEAKNWFHKAAAQDEQIALWMMKKLTEKGF